MSGWIGLGILFVGIAILFIIWLILEDKLDKEKEEYARKRNK